MKFNSIVNSKLWDDAVWQAFGIAEYSWGMSIFLGFKNANSMIKIFEEWKEKIGSDDESDRIKITIIKGINSSQPNYYRVHISTGIQLDELREGERFYTSSRFHEMNPSSSTNLDRIIQGFDRYKCYKLIPAKIIDPTKGQIEPILQHSIVKYHLHIKSAWQVGIDDPDSVAIKKHDTPIIPDNIHDPPIKDLLRKKNESQ
jgi:hypothetical protein